MTEERDAYQDEERNFFERADGWDGAPIDPDYLDPELTSLEPPPSIMQPILLLMVLAFSVFLGWQYRYEVAYFFSGSEAVDLGRADQLRTDAQNVQGGNLELESNRYVAIDGIAYRELLTTQHRYRQFLGAPILIREPATDELLEEEEPQTFGEYVASRGVREDLQLRGRLVEAGDLSPRERGIFKNYGTEFGIRYCDVRLAPAVENHITARYEEALLELTDELGRAPTADEALAAAGPECTKVYLLDVNRTPSSFMNYLFVMLGFAFAAVVSIVLLVHWIKRARRSAG